MTQSNNQEMCIDHTDTKCPHQDGQDIHLKIMKCAKDDLKRTETIQKLYRNYTEALKDQNKS